MPRMLLIRQNRLKTPVKVYNRACPALIRFTFFRSLYFKEELQNLILPISISTVLKLEKISYVFIRRNLMVLDPVVEVARKDFSVTIFLLMRIGDFSIFFNGRIIQMYFINVIF